MGKKRKEKSGVIYKYTNKINGKVYIGQTIDAKRRKRDHINSSRNVHGWSILKENVLKTNTFINKKLGITEINKPNEYMNKKYDLTNSTVCNLAKGIVKSHKGWRIHNGD